MKPATTRSDGSAVDTSAGTIRVAEEDQRLDRRSLIRGAGTVLLATALAGCYHDDDGGGDSDDDDGISYSNPNDPPTINGR